MKDRIIQVMKIKSVNAAELADLMQVKRPSLSHIMTGRNNPSLDFIIRLKETFPEINLDWLLFGKGPVTSSPDVKSPNVMPKRNQALLFEEGSNEETHTGDIGNEVKTAVKEIAVLPPKDLFSQITESKPTELAVNEIAKKNEVQISLENEPQIKKTLKKPVKMILIYEDETFTLFDYQSI